MPLYKQCMWCGAAVDILNINHQTKSNHPTYQTAYSCSNCFKEVSEPLDFGNIEIEEKKIVVRNDDPPVADLGYGLQAGASDCPLEMLTSEQKLQKRIETEFDELGGFVGYRLPQMYGKKDDQKII